MPTIAVCPRISPPPLAVRPAPHGNARIMPRREAAGAVGVLASARIVRTRDQGGRGATVRHHRYLIFTVLTLTTLVYAMQFTTIAVALPDVIEDLEAPLNWSGWVLTLFM